jgi:hypothetical protein
MNPKPIKRTFRNLTGIPKTFLSSPSSSTERVRLASDAIGDSSPGTEKLSETIFQPEEETALQRQNRDFKIFPRTD